MPKKRPSRSYTPLVKHINRVTAKKVTRPRDKYGRVIVDICEKWDCSKPAARGQLYCSKECSPLGLYGLRKYNPDTE